MNLFEAGIISGGPAGAAIAVVICKSQGVVGIVGGCVTGLVSGAMAGWLYSLVLMFLMAVLGALWRAARDRADKALTKVELDMMQPIAVRGIFLAAVTGFAVFMGFGWLQALVATLALALVTAFLAVARCELRGGENARQDDE